MNTYEVKLEFVDGTKITVEVDATNEEEAYEKAMPIRLNII